jgi:hypothetical protein
MERQSVQSSNIAEIGYDSDLSVLEIKFLDGSVYQYLGVPEDIFQGIMSAPSHGKYFHQYVKDKYNFKKIQ